MSYPPITGGASLIIALPLLKKTTLIVGAGQLAVARTNAALQADSRVVIVVWQEYREQYQEEIRRRWERGEIEVIELEKDVEETRIEDVIDSIGGASVAFITDTLIGLPRRRSYESAAGICKALKKRNILVNVADQPSLCDFTLPACHRFSYKQHTESGNSLTNNSQKSPQTMLPSSLQIAVTTNGKGCRLASRIRREIISKLPPDIGDAVENISALRRAAKEMSISPSSDSEGSEDSLPSTPNDPVPQRKIEISNDTEYAAAQETEEEAQKRRMRWVAQISEFWPLERLGSLDTRQRADILNDAIHEHHTVSRKQPTKQSSQALDSPFLRSPSVIPSHHTLDSSSGSTTSRRGSIYLLGSGPGHPGLLTVAAHAILTTRATLVLSDKLVPSEVLALIPSTVNVKIAKKFPGNAEGAQNEMMLDAVEAAGRGEIVVRLKQGDPMVYGRAGEEILYFRQHGYEAIVIPGLSSAIAGPTFAGIPVTQRGAAESVVICTGVGRGGRGTRLPGYQRERTLVLLMGVARLDELVVTLTSSDEENSNTRNERGRRDGATYPSNLPIAIIERASMPDQRVISGTLATITSAMKSAAVGEQRPPGMIVVGWSVLALVGAGDVAVLDDAVGTPEGELVKRDEERINRWLKDGGWLVKEGFTRWD